VLTVGDNNYPRGEASTLAANLGPYRQYIEAGRFLPALGNHDWQCRDCPQPYLQLFQLPGNGRYYSVALGDLGIWVLDSDDHEPDGIDVRSIQARWLRDGLASSACPLKLVILHHPPYSSGHHGPSRDVRWPFAAWGASAVFSGHEHSYERLERDGIPYFVNGSAGAGLRGFHRPVEGSRFRYSSAHGAQRITLDGSTALFEFWNVHGQRVDAIALAYRSSLAPAAR
ncbi:MAG: metallophosphoesterase, partial [Chloroflexota bacterium]|nr:metallophosphoesterase [Chloroflexota bacterium]